MKRRSLGIALALGATAALGALTHTAQAGHSWSTYHWARATDATVINLRVVDSVTDDWQQNYDDSLGAWTITGLLEFTTVAADDSTKARKQCRAVAGQMRVCNAAYGYNGWLGLAQIWLDSDGHISQGTAKMNDSYSSYWTPEEKNHVMCQEIGHVFGLGHTSEDGSSQGTCMDYSTSADSQWPNAHDYEQLAAMYDHGDGYNSFDDSTGGGGGDGGGDGGGPPCSKKPDHPNCVPSGTFGELISSSDHHEWYVRPSGDGLVLTHLYLAP